MSGGSHSEMMLGRLLAVDWTAGTSFDHARSRARLIREYLRRSAWWARTLDAVAEWPFFDIAAHLAPEVHVPEDLARQLEDLISTRIGWPSVAEACRAALHWAALTDARIPPAYGLDDPYEPLVLLFERGRWLQHRTRLHRSRRVVNTPGNLAGPPCRRARCRPHTVHTGRIGPRVAVGCGRR
jgi:hypothetical protein